MSSRSQGLRDLASQPWKSIQNICKDAAVFVDDSCAELLHWAGGVELLRGCVGVHDLYSDLTPVASNFIASVSIVFHNAHLRASHPPPHTLHALHGRGPGSRVGVV